MPQILFSDPKPDGTVDWWYAETLWKHAEGLPVVPRRVDELPGMDCAQFTVTVDKPVDNAGMRP